MPIVLLTALLFNFILGISYVIIPLYAHHIGLSGMAIGTLMSIPYIIQIASRFVGGSLSDWYGEKKLIIASFVLFALAGIIFSLADDAFWLLVAQTAAVIARGVFWPVIQSLVTHIAKDVKIMMGRLNACNNVGSISGTIAAGFIISDFGFNFGFSTFTAIGIIALIVVFLWLPKREQPMVQRKGNMLQEINICLRSRPIIFAMVCSFVAAQPYILGQSFFPIYLSEIGFSSEQIGQLLSVRAVGGILAGLLLARYINPIEGAWSISLYTFGMAFSLILTSAFPHFIFLSFVLLGMGLSSETMHLFYQLIASETSDASYRGAALVVAGLGWSIANVITPFFFGIIVDLVSIHYSFYIWGGIILLLGFGMVPLHRFGYKNLKHLKKYT